MRLQTKIHLFGTASHFSSDCVWDTQIQFVWKALMLFLVVALILGRSLELYELLCGFVKMGIIMPFNNIFLLIKIKQESFLKIKLLIK